MSPGKTDCSCLPDSFIDPDQRDALRAIIGASDDRTCLRVFQGPTGFGKTRVGVALVDHFIRKGYRVLWVAKKWRLLEQAADELVDALPRLKNCLRRVGGDRESLNLSTAPLGQIFFTTLSTWCSRKTNSKLPRELHRAGNLLVIWDECHWACNAKTGDTFLDHYVPHDAPDPSQNALVVGMSATPRKHRSDRMQLVWDMTYASVIGTRVAQPIHKDVETGIVWNPIVNNHVVTPGSLNKLASNRDRNEMIVQELKDGRHEGRYKRVVIFACNIKHAITLQKKIDRSGIPSQILHSQLPKRERERAVASFRSGKVDVLVNINQFAKGDNVPEIDAIFIARPITSEVMIRQMIGRGSRLIPGKSSFYVVQFSDVVLKHADEFYQASNLIDDLKPKSRRPNGRPRYVSPAKHAAPKTQSFENLYFPELGDITFVQGQTFGVEIELTSPGHVPKFNTKWKKTANQIIDRLSDTAHGEVHCKPEEYHEYRHPGKWVVENDVSAGWEVVSPILMDAEGFHELRRVCEGLNDLVLSHPDLHLNYRTGMHITLATRLNTLNRQMAFAKRIQRLEPGLMTLVSPSRFYRFNAGEYHRRSRNKYCRALRETLNFNLFDRYTSVNLTQVDLDAHKLEVRLHGGTTEFRKIALWISLWMQIFNRSRYKWAGKGAIGSVFPGGNKGISRRQVKQEDIFELLKMEDIWLSSQMIRALDQRRKELKKSWENAIPKRVGSWANAGWYSTALESETDES